MLTLASSVRILVAAEAVNLRRDFDGLAAGHPSIIRESLERPSPEGQEVIHTNMSLHDLDIVLSTNLPGQVPNLHANLATEQPTCDTIESIPVGNSAKVQ